MVQLSEPVREAVMALRETELESEFEDESEFESEFEDESEDFDLGGVISGLLGEGEFEEELEDEGEAEGEEFDLGGVISGLLGEGEGEFEDESEEFFGNIARFVRKNAPLLKQIARVAAPMVGTALGGPLGGALGNMAVRALGEGEFEDEGEFELEGEFEDELEGEEEGEEFDLGGVLSGLLGEGEFEDEASHSMTEAEAMAEMMATIAAGASTEAEAEAMIGAATVTTLSARDRAELRRLLPHLVRASCVLTRLLRRNRRTRPVVAAVPTIVQRTARDLTRRASAGRPVNRRVAARVMSRQTQGVLGSPRRTAAALQRNARATSAMRRTAGSRRRSQPRRPRRHVHRRRAYGYR
jgi:hypothetical protein